MSQLDIIAAPQGADLKLYRSDLGRAANLLAVQVGELEYAQDFGVDLRFFLESDFQIQVESFRAYCIERLLSKQINVVASSEALEALFTRLTYTVGESTSSEGLIA